MVGLCFLRRSGGMCRSSDEPTGLGRLGGNRGVKVEHVPKRDARCSVPGPGFKYNAGTAAARERSQNEATGPEEW